jgi:arylformamidase
MARIFDVSLPIDERLLVWPGDPPIEIEPASRISKGDAANVSQLHLGSHTGTHIDPPFHFIDGAPTIEALPIDALVGEAFVADLTSASSRIGAADLDSLGIDQNVSRLLLKTKNSERWAMMPMEFPNDFTSLGTDGAEWIVERGIRLVGIDFLGIEARGAEGHPTHKTLLQQGVVIVEGLDLSQVDPGTYQLVCLPLRIVGGDGAPARAILIRD